MDIFLCVGAKRSLIEVMDITDYSPACSKDASYNGTFTEMRRLKNVIQEKTNTIDSRFSGKSELRQDFFF